MNASFPAFHLNQRKTDRLNLPGTAKGRRVNVIKLTFRQVANHPHTRECSCHVMSFLPALSAYSREEKYFPNPDAWTLSHTSQHLSKLPPNLSLWKSELKCKLYSNSCLKQNSTNPPTFLSLSLSVGPWCSLTISQIKQF